MSTNGFDSGISGDFNFAGITVLPAAISASAYAGRVDTALRLNFHITLYSNIAARSVLRIAAYAGASIIIVGCVFGRACCCQFFIPLNNQICIRLNAQSCVSAFRRNKAVKCGNVHCNGGTCSHSKRALIGGGAAARHYSQKSNCSGCVGIHFQPPVGTHTVANHSYVCPVEYGINIVLVRPAGTAKTRYVVQYNEVGGKITFVVIIAYRRLGNNRSAVCNYYAVVDNGTVGGVQRTAFHSNTTVVCQRSAGVKINCFIVGDRYRLFLWYGCAVKRYGICRRSFMKSREVVCMHYCISIIKSGNQHFVNKNNCIAYFKRPARIIVAAGANASRYDGTTVNGQVVEIGVVAGADAGAILCSDAGNRSAINYNCTAVVISVAANTRVILSAGSGQAASTLDCQSCSGTAYSRTEICC